MLKNLINRRKKMHTDRNVYMYICTRRGRAQGMHTHMHTYTHAHAHTRTHIHTLSNTHTHRTKNIHRHTHGARACKAWADPHGHRHTCTFTVMKESIGYTHYISYL